jgi:hypothetical protein
MNPSVSAPQQKNEGKVNFKCSDVGLRIVIGRSAATASRKSCRRSSSMAAKSMVSKSTTILATEFAMLSIGKRHRCFDGFNSGGGFGRPFLVHRIRAGA